MGSGPESESKKGFEAREREGSLGSEYEAERRAT
jgi:hypothetical protein